MQPEIGSCNDGLTICPICGTQFQRVGRQRLRADAWRQATWRLRHPAPLPVAPATALALDSTRGGADALADSVQRCPASVDQRSRTRVTML